MKDEFGLLLERFTDERATHRRREAFLTSVILHLVLIILILVSPKLFTDQTPKKSAKGEAGESSKQLGFLAPPKDYRKLQQNPKAPTLSDRDRMALRKAPKIDSKSLRAPRPERNTKRPESSEPPKTADPAGQPASPVAKTAPDENKAIAKMRLPQPSAASPEEPKRNLRELAEGFETPGFSIKDSIEKARESGNYGSGSPSGGPLKNFDNRLADFSVEEPTIRSDTHGIDFSIWLRLVYFRVRDNWHSVIPELIRSGTKGKVVILFDVYNNGRIDNLQVVRSSGLSPYDRAAVSSLKLSEPFPSFPPAFRGEFITLQFSYLYNIRL